MEMKEKVENEQIKFMKELEDLPVIEEDAEETKGGGTASGKLYVATNVGVFITI